MPFTQTALASLFLFSLLLFYLPFTLLLFLRLRPIHFRTPILILLLDITLIFIGLNHFMNATFPDHYPTLVANLLSFLPQCNGFLIHGFRQVHLLFNYKITEEVGKQRVVPFLRDHCSQGDVEEEGGSSSSSSHPKIPDIHPRRSWYLTHRWLLSLPLAITVLIVQDVLLLLYFFFMFSISQEFWWNGYGQGIFQNSLGVLMAIYLGVAIFLTWKLKDCSGDIYRMKTEVSVIGVIAGVTLAATWLLPFVGLATIKPVVGLVGLHAVLFVGTVVPYSSHFRHGRRPGGAGGGGGLQLPGGGQAEGNLSLMELLKTPEGFACFFNYLKKEFSSENLVFWEQVNALKQIQDLELLKETVFSIFTTFIASNSIYRVNIPSEMRDAICAQVQALSEGYNEMLVLPELNFNPDNIEDVRRIFDTAQKNIFDSLNNDSYLRFQNLSASERNGMNLLQGVQEEQYEWKTTLELAAASTRDSPRRIYSPATPSVRRSESSELMLLHTLETSPIASSPSSLGLGEPATSTSTLELKGLGGALSSPETTPLEEHNTVSTSVHITSHDG